MTARTTPAALLFTLLLAAAVAPASPEPSSPAPGELARARELLGALDGGPVRALAAALDSLSLAATARPAEPVALPGAPRAIRRALERLAGAIATAERLRTRALRDLTEPQRAAILRGDAAAVRRAPVHERLLADAALTILEAVDRATPRGAVAAAASSCGAGGSVVYESADCSIVVGGDGSNTYDHAALDPTLLLDLGGDDTYLGPAAYAEIGVRVLVDVDGDDTYLDDQSAASTEPIAVFRVRGQGMGTLGVGVLADLAGDDSYTIRARTTAPEPGPVSQQARAQGQGSAFAGAGVLLDAAGSDRFTIEATTDGSGAWAAGQGNAIGGIGALLDFGADGDAYQARATSREHQTHASPTNDRFGIGPGDVEAQGASEVGNGILVEAGGSDTYLARAAGGTGDVVAQGGGGGGGGLLVDGSGDDSTVATAIGRTHDRVTIEDGTCHETPVEVHLPASRALAQGGAILGTATLVDGGGNDVRRIEASSAALASSTTTNQQCPGGSNAAIAVAAAAGTLAYGQGGASFGDAALVDVGGDDVYAMSSVTTATAAATNRSSGPEKATATAGPSRTLGQGAVEQTARGVLADTGGDDSYASTAVTTTVETTSQGTATTDGAVQEWVQGWANSIAGLGLLFDGDGADSYTAPAAGNDRCWSEGGYGRGWDRGFSTTLCL
ncbi:MAG TPA: hypothetical protein VGB83_12080 [Actinomycetota bacterium]